VEELQDDDNFQNIMKGVLVEVSPKSRFQRYSEELGSGSYKKVYRGYDAETGAEIAWNVI
jgi:WNK lysine deficient protein kinase